MASFGAVRLRQDAEKEEKAGRLERALGLYQQVVRANPEDWAVVKKIGDLHVRLGQVKEAVGVYARLAEHWTGDGFLLRAIALWKQVGRLDPGDLGPTLQLADLYGRQGLVGDAKEHYRLAFEGYVKRGRVREAGGVLERMARLDPADLEVRFRLIDLHVRSGDPAQAVAECVAVGEELAGNGRLAEALRVLECGAQVDARSSRVRLELGRIHLARKDFPSAIRSLEEAARLAGGQRLVETQLGRAYLGAGRLADAEALLRKVLEANPTDEDACTEMGRLSLKQGRCDEAFGRFLPVVDRLIGRKEAEGAARLLQEILQRNPLHVQTLLKLAEIYRLVRKESAVADTYVQLVEAYVHEERFEQAASVLEHLVELEPQNAQHRGKLEYVRGKTGAEPGAPLRPAATPAQPGPEDEEFIRERLDDALMLRKYGLLEKAAKQLDAILARFPAHPEARRVLELVVGKDDGAPPLPGREEAVSAHPPATSDVIDDELMHLVLEEDDFPSAEPGSGVDSAASNAAPRPGQPLGGEVLLADFKALFETRILGAPPENRADRSNEDVVETIDQFRKGVERLVDREDHETRYNLGIAYKEMGLLDEAIVEFQLVARSEAHLFACASMLALCFLEKGRPDLAVTWLERGLAASGRSEEEYRALRDDLAAARGAVRG